MTTAARRVAAGRAALRTGRRAEERVRDELERLGWRTLECNVVSRGGEIDLVMMDGATIVFVEVRQRSGDAFGGALASLGARKTSRVRRAAALWLARRELHDASVRFDAVLLDGPGASARLTHLRDAF